MTTTTILLTHSEVESLLRCSRSALYSWMEGRNFPRPRKFGRAKPMGPERGPGMGPRAAPRGDSGCLKRC